MTTQLVPNCRLTLANPHLAHEDRLFSWRALVLKHLASTSIILICLTPFYPSIALFPILHLMVSVLYLVNFPQFDAEC